MSAWLERLWYPEGEESALQKVAASPLLLGEAVFGLGARVRGALYDRGILESARAEGARVVSVGNLTVGGAGKTPVVIHLARLLAGRGRRVVVLSRGYGRAGKERLALEAGRGELPSAAEAGDEPLLIARNCPGVPVLVGADRVASAREARERFGAEVILLDDGMQHRRLARDVDIAVVDEQVGLGNGHLLPRGPLREPASALRRASLLWVREAEGGAARPLPGVEAPVVRARHRVRGLVSPQGVHREAEALRGQPVLALAGLARPGSFLRTLEGLGLVVVERRLFPDHHLFTPAELEEVRGAANRAGLAVVTTEKDRVRLPAEFPAWVARLEIEVVSGAEALELALGG